MDTEEEEKKKEIEQLLTGYLNIKTEKELEKTRFNEAKIDMQWRELLREEKTEDLQDELLMAKQAFERSVAYKDLKIEALKMQLEEADVQEMWAMHSHTQAMDELVSTSQQRSECLRQQYLENLEKQKQVFAEIEKEIVGKTSEEKSKSKDLKYIANAMLEKTAEKTTTHFRHMQEKLKIQELTEIDEIHDRYDDNLAEVWMKLQKVLLKYQEHGQKLEKLFNDMKVQCDESFTDVEQLKKQMKGLNSTLPELRFQIEERRKQNEERVKKTIAENEGFTKYAVEMKEKITKLQRHDKASLINIVTNSDAAIKELKRLVSKGEKILKLSDLCQKLEAEFEDSPENSLLSPEDEEQLKTNGTFVPPEDLDMDDFKYYGLLDNFSKRRSKVKLQNLALQRELQDLHSDNEKLKSAMSKFLKRVAEGEIQRLPADKVETVHDPPLIQEAALLTKRLPTIQDKLFKK